MIHKKNMLTQNYLNKFFYNNGIVIITSLIYITNRDRGINKNKNEVMIHK